MGVLENPRSWRCTFYFRIWLNSSELHEIVYKYKNTQWLPLIGMATCSCLLYSLKNIGSCLRLFASFIDVKDIQMMIISHEKWWT